LIHQFENHWLFKSATKILSLFSAKEVKTPLSFFLRMVYAVVALATLGVFLLPDKERLEIFIGAGSLLFLLAIIVGAITWSKPQNLVYGETGYRVSSSRSVVRPSRGKNSPPI
jgi:hypothetical protein